MQPEDFLLHPVHRPVTLELDHRFFTRPVSVANTFIHHVVYSSEGTLLINHIHRRCTMKVSQAVDFHLQYHQANSKKKYHQDM